MQIISVENVSKKFILAHNRPKNLADGLSSMLRRIPRENFWALKDVSFKVEQGEALGIIGSNGAGKSTMLKLLTGIMQPTNGRMRIRGRVSALIEVGAGFHPEMSGRENIYLNGSILGMSHGEIARKFDAIVAFAELERFIDTPVKRYSSGMYARLGFAIAAHVEPEVMIVDEVLSVGDMAFQRKCLKRMETIRLSEGTTVLFVSHNLVAVQKLCKRAVWLEHGVLKADGPSVSVIAGYLGTSVDQMTYRLWDDIDDAPGNNEIRIHKACVRPVDGLSSDIITTDTDILLEFEYWNLEPDNYLNIGLHLINDDGVVIFTSSPSKEIVWHGKPFPCGLFKSIC
ncbi:MAG: ABC transporter ATP-binding protein, partial [Armatimonadota bacterium]